MPVLSRSRLAREERKIACAPLTDPNPLVTVCCLNDHNWADFQTKQPSEWMEIHENESQTYSQWLSSIRSRDRYMPTAKKHTIYVQLIDDLDFYPGMINLIQGYLERFFIGCTVKIQELITLTDMKIEPRVIEHHEQYSAEAIIKYLQSDLPDDAFCRVGLTMSDLYSQTLPSFVFGLANPYRGCAVISFSRFGLPEEQTVNAYESDSNSSSDIEEEDQYVTKMTLHDKKKDAFFEAYEEEYMQMCEKRIVQLITHEIGHLFFFSHCTWYECLMNGVNNIEELDRSPLHLCPVCLRKLYVGLSHKGGNINLYNRYTALYAFNRAAGLIDKNSFIQKRIKTIRKEIKKKKTRKEGKEITLEAEAEESQGKDKEITKEANCKTEGC